MVTPFLDNDLFLKTELKLLGDQHWNTNKLHKLTIRDGLLLASKMVYQAWPFITEVTFSTKAVHITAGRN